MMPACGKFLTGGGYAPETACVSTQKGRRAGELPGERETEGGFRVQVMSLSGTVGSLGQRGPRAAAAWALIATGSMLSMASRCWGEDSRGMQSRKALNV